MTDEHRAKKIRRLILSPEKSYNLLVYAKMMAAQYERHGCGGPKPSKPKYAADVVHFLDVSAAEGEETAEESSSSVSMTNSTAT